MKVESRFQADFTRIHPGRSFTTIHIASALITDPGTLSCFLYRLQESAHNKGNVRVATLLRGLNISLTGADFAPGCDLGPGLVIRHPVGIVVGCEAVAGPNCTLLQQVTLGEKYADGRSPHEYPVLGENVVVGAGVKILGAVHVGDWAVIGANAVVTSDVPPGATAVGIPARVMFVEPRPPA